MTKHLKSFSFLALSAALGMLFSNSGIGQNIASDTPLDELIQITDQIKISNSEQFNANLAVLKSRQAEVSPEQQDLIRYLEAYVFVLDGDLEHAQQELLSLFNATESKYIKVRIKATLANIQAVSREYNQALNNLDYALNHVESIGDADTTNKINLISGIVYYLLEIFDMSSKYTELVINANPDGKMLCKASVYHLLSYLKLNQTLSEQTVLDTINECKRNEELVYASILELNWINNALQIAHQNRNHDRISDLFTRIKRLEQKVDEFGYNHLIGLKDMALAKMYFFQGEKALAVQSARKSIDGSSQSGNTPQVVEALKILVEDAVQQNDFKQAYDLSAQINQVENEIYNQTKAKQMAYMSAKHNNLAKQIEIQQLKQNNQLLVLENQLSDEANTNQKLLMLLIISVLLLLGLWAYKIKRRHDYFKEVSEIDHLTQVFTRKAFEEKLKSMLERNRDKQQPVSLAIMDLDHFKKVNDLYGHLAGDWVLKHVILTSQAAADHDILVARLGGEEFAIVCEGVDEKGMFVLLDQIRGAIENLDCSPSGADFKITASFGYSTAKLSGYRMSMLLTHADLALFEAKNNGRNQVLSFTQIKPAIKAVN